VDEKLKILELIRDGKVNPEQGLELLDAIGEGGPASIVGDFIGVRADEGRARFLRFSVLSRKGKEFTLNIPLGVVRFAYNLFPGRFNFKINDKELDTEELMDRIYREEVGIIYRDEEENVICELI
jgi:hypothetical protein